MTVHVKRENTRIDRLNLTFELGKRYRLVSFLNEVYEGVYNGHSGKELDIMPGNLHLLISKDYIARVDEIGVDVK